MKKYLLPLFVLLLAGVLVLTFVSAMEWPLDKQGTCTMFNKTGLECEVYWCNFIQEGNYSLTKEVCEFSTTIIVNQTINATASNETTNATANVTSNLNSTDFYNRSEIDFLLNNKTGELRNSISDNYALKSEVQLSSSSAPSSGIKLDTGIVMVIIVLVVGGGFIYWNSTKGKALKTSLQRGDAPTEQLPLQTRKEMGTDDKLNKALKRLEELEKDKKEKEDKK